MRASSLAQQAHPLPRVLDLCFILALSVKSSNSTLPPSRRTLRRPCLVRSAPLVLLVRRSASRAGTYRPATGCPAGPSCCLPVCVRAYELARQALLKPTLRIAHARDAECGDADAASVVGPSSQTRMGCVFFRLTTSHLLTLRTAPHRNSSAARGKPPPLANPSRLTRRSRSATLVGVEHRRDMLPLERVVNAAVILAQDGMQAAPLHAH
jgi:hypothetical protein